VDGWKFDVEPEPYELRFRDAKYALVLIMGSALQRNRNVT
jgi:hypothetical protein